MSLIRDSYSSNIMATPRSVDLAITSMCNLSCNYCSHFSSAGDVKEDLPKEEWFVFFRELKRCGVMNVVFTGGEPFCRNDLMTLIDGVVRNNMRFSILSNGTLIDNEVALFLYSTGRCDGVQVSIDGQNSLVNDYFRGEGTFCRATEGIKALNKYHIRVRVRVTIHKQNVRYIQEITRFLFEDIGIKSMSTNSASYMGMCRQNSERLQLTIEELSIAMETLLKLEKQYIGRISATAGPLAQAREWISMKTARQNDVKRQRVGGYLLGCNCPMVRIAVRADGVMVPCTQLSHIELGRINCNNLNEVWINHPALERLRRRHTISLRDFDFCKACDYVDYCTGGCPALAHSILGNDQHPAPNDCLKRFLEAGGNLPSSI